MYVSQAFSNSRNSSEGYVKVVGQTILAADCADYADGPRLLAADQSNSANAGHPRNPRNPRLLVLEGL